MTATVIYWSMTGNTQLMAQNIAQGATDAGAQVTLKEVGAAGVEDVANSDVLLLGCPSMGDEVLEESEFEPFIESIIDQVAGKKIALFGSFDWGDGQWMRDWSARMSKAGAQLVVDSLIVNLTPQGDSLETCKAFGKKACS